MEKAGSSGRAPDIAGRRRNHEPRDRPVPFLPVSGHPDQIKEPYLGGAEVVSGKRSLPLHHRAGVQLLGAEVQQRATEFRFAEDHFPGPECLSAAERAGGKHLSHFDRMRQVVTAP